VSLDEAKLRKARAEAHLAELELARQRGESISRDFFHRFITAANARVRSRLLAVPNKLGSRVPLEVRGQVVEATRTEIHDALNELADTKVTVVGPGEPDDLAPGG